MGRTKQTARRNLEAPKEKEVEREKKDDFEAVGALRDAYEQKTLTGTFACGGELSLSANVVLGLCIDQERYPLPCTTGAHGEGTVSGERVSFAVGRAEWDAKFKKMVEDASYMLGVLDHFVYAKPFAGNPVPGMFGILLVQMPSVFAGGELVVDHQGQQRKFFGSSDGGSVNWAAFYSSVAKHHMAPLESGHRLILSYALCTDSEALPMIPSHSDLTDLLEKAFQESPVLYFEMENRYTSEALWSQGLDVLDGNDRRAVAMLKASFPKKDYYVGCARLECVWQKISQIGLYNDGGDDDKESETVTVKEIKLPDPLNDFRELLVFPFSKNLVVSSFSKWSKKEISSEHTDSNEFEETESITYSRHVLFVLNVEPASFIRLAKSGAAAVRLMKAILPKGPLIYIPHQILSNCSLNKLDNVLKYVIEAKSSTEDVSQVLSSVLHHTHSHVMYGRKEQRVSEASFKMIAQLLELHGSSLQDTVVPLLAKMEDGFAIAPFLDKKVFEGNCKTLAEGIALRKDFSKICDVLLLDQPVLPNYCVKILSDGLKNSSTKWINHESLISMWKRLHAKWGCIACEGISAHVDKEILVLIINQDHQDLFSCPVFSNLVEKEKKLLKESLAVDLKKLGWEQPDAVFEESKKIENFLRGPKSSIDHAPGGLLHARKLTGQFGGGGYRFASASFTGKGSKAMVHIEKNKNAYIQFRKEQARDGRKILSKFENLRKTDQEPELKKSKKN